MNAGSPSDAALRAIVREEVERRGAIPFARFMELALYHPQHGYYARGAEALGTEGDFFTASDAGTWFGRCLARQLAEIDDLLGRPDPFRFIEFAPGRGLLARDVLDALAAGYGDLAQRLQCVLVDRSPGMRSEAAGRVPEAVVVDPEDLEPGGVGCVVAVELFDALPVHRTRHGADEVREVMVGAGEGGALVECERPPSEAVLELARRYRGAAEEGHETEVCPEILPALRAMGAALERGILFVVDYGGAAEEIYGPANPRGTLLAYSRHATNEEFLERIGRQDLTAWVNFSAVEDAARELKLDVLGRTTQDRFLIGNGILDAFDAEVDDALEVSGVKRRLQAMQLIHPSAMGRRFQVLALAKRFRSRPQLRGLQDPFA
ncbi:MAG: hypothetical protein GY716_10460 [bacterium]|nr:hypothetical protein [bacterium]